MPVHRHPVALTGPAHARALASVPLDRELIRRLRATYTLVRECEVHFAEIFYAKLFTAAPNLRSLFRTEPQQQAEKLTASLDAIVRNLEAPDENAEMLIALGRRHVGYGVKPEHYDLVIELLIQSMSELLGAKATAQALDEWRLALRLVSDQMIAAARTSPP